MAFTTTNVRCGTVGNLKLIAGEWSGAAADANGVMFIQSGRSYMELFNSADSNNGPIQTVGSSVGSNVGTATTVNIENRQNVTNGRFLIIRA